MLTKCAPSKLILAALAATGTLMHPPAAHASLSLPLPTPQLLDKIIFNYNILNTGANPGISSISLLKATLTNTRATADNVIDQVSLLLEPQWPKEDNPGQNITQVAFQLFGFVDGDVSYYKETGCSPAPDATDVDCNLTSIAFGTSVAGGGSVVDNLNFIVDLPPGGQPTKGNKNTGTEIRLNGSPETLTLIFEGSQGKGLNVFNFIDPPVPASTQGPPPKDYLYYSCAHVQSIPPTGSSLSTCANDYDFIPDNPEEPKEPTDVPAPAAILGLGSAFAFSRRLRERQRRHGLLIAGR